MDPEKWRRVKEVFDGALACESEAQSQYVAQACQGDADILSEVETLLHHHRQANSRRKRRLQSQQPIYRRPGSEAVLASIKYCKRSGTAAWAKFSARNAWMACMKSKLR